MALACLSRLRRAPPAESCRATTGRHWLDSRDQARWVSDQFRQAASYIDRILKGAKAGDLRVQTTTKYSLVINLKAAKALGIELPMSLMLSANEVIE
jgi:hypothetical protein